jgi:hypothetical protein
MNKFPHDIALDVPKDHAILRSTFDYIPTTLEMHAKMWQDQK